MRHIIFSINSMLSKKIGRLVLDIFEGTIRIYKSKQFSGQLRKADLEDKSFDNLNNEETTNIYSIFSEENVAQISKNQFVLTIPAFKCLYNILSGKNCLYISLNKQMHLIEDAYFDCKISKVAGKTEIISEQLNKIIYGSNTVYFIEENTPPPSVGAKVEETPLVSLYLKIGKITFGTLYFNYKGIRIPANDSRPMFRATDALIVRDYKSETMFTAILKAAGFIKSRNNDFRYGKALTSLTSNLNILINSGFKIFIGDKIVNSSGRFSYGVAYKNDWFEVDFKIDDQIIDLSKIIDIHGDACKYFEYNDGIFLLPDSISATFSDLERRGNSLGFRKDKISKVFNFTEGQAAKTFDESEWLDYKDIELSVGNNFCGTLNDYQKDGVRWLKFLIQNGLGGCLADDMGLGKTVQIIALLCDDDIRVQKLKTLIVVPKSLLHNWEAEFKKFAPGVNIGIYWGSNKNEYVLEANEIVLTTFQTFVQTFEQEGFNEISLLVVDEIQNANNESTSVSKLIKKLDCRVKIGLSGTPAENNINELKNIADIIMPGLLPDTEFKPNNLNLRSEEIKRRISPFFLRRTKEEALKGLPEKTIKTIYCEMGEAQEKLYKSLLTSVKNYIDSTNERFVVKSNADVLRMLLFLREACCDPRLLSPTFNPSDCKESAKIETLKMVVHALISKGEKVIIFSQFTQMLEIINSELKVSNYPIYMLTGKTKNRKDVIREFESASDGIFLISLKAGGVGLNLTSCRYGIIYDPWWNISAEKQAIDRMHRIGQKHKVSIYKLILKNTIEEKVCRLQEKKSEIIDNVIENLSNDNELSKNMLKALLD